MQADHPGRLQRHVERRVCRRGGRVPEIWPVAVTPSNCVDAARRGRAPGAPAPDRGRGRRSSHGGRAGGGCRAGSASVRGRRRRLRASTTTTAAADEQDHSRDGQDAAPGEAPPEGLVEPLDRDLGRGRLLLLPAHGPRRRAAGPSGHPSSSPTSWRSRSRAWCRVASTVPGAAVHDLCDGGDVEAHEVVQVDDQPLAPRPRPSTARSRSRSRVWTPVPAPSTSSTTSREG